MFRYVVMVLTFSIGVTAALLARVTKPEPAMICLAVGAVCLLVFLHAAINVPLPGSEKGTSVVGLVRLWMRAKERELQARADQ